MCKIFYHFFDFSLPSLIKILIPTKHELENTHFNNYTNINSNNYSTRRNISVRAAFIEFWIDLIEKIPPLLRKDLLINNAKIMCAWFKYMDKCDSCALMFQAISSFVKQYIE